MGLFRTSRLRRRCKKVTVILGSAGFIGLLGACTREAGGDRGQGPDIIWTEQSLPSHPGAPGRTVVRDAVRCGDAWYVTGAVFLDAPTETRDTRPALWSSRDGSTWEAIPVDADTYWGRRAILNSVACSRDRIAAVGARSGGAHGNPRVTTFHLLNGRLVDVQAVFTQFGGVSATNVGPISGGPNGWLIVGNRLSGPGVWVTDDPRGFTRVEGEAGLTQDGDLQSIAQAAAWSGNGWVMVGAGAEPGKLLNRDPLAWTSPDGRRWTPQAMPATRESEDAHKIVPLPDGTLLAVGLRGDTFAAWTYADEWSAASRFGSVAQDWTGAPYVASLATTPVGVLATISDGSVYQLWHSTKGEDWTQLEAPEAPSTAGDHALTAGSGGGLLLLADKGTGGRVWTGSVR